MRIWKYGIVRAHSAKTIASDQRGQGGPACLALGLLIAAAVLGGCASFDQAQQVREELALLHTHLDQRADELAAAASALDPDDPAQPSAQALASKAKSGAEALGVSLSGLEAVLNEAQHPSDPITRTVESIGPWLPEPIRTPAVFVAAAGALAWRSSRLKQGLRSVVLSIEAAKRSDEEFRRCFSRHIETFRAAQSPAAQHLIRRITEPALAP